jgi:hypothetical protein
VFFYFCDFRRRLLDLNDDKRLLLEANHNVQTSTRNRVLTFDLVIRHASAASREFRAPNSKKFQHMVSAFEFL